MKATKKMSRIRIRISIQCMDGSEDTDPYPNQNVTDPEHYLMVEVLAGWALHELVVALLVEGFAHNARAVKFCKIFSLYKTEKLEKYRGRYHIYQMGTACRWQRRLVSNDVLDKDMVRTGTYILE